MEGGGAARRGSRPGRRPIRARPARGQSAAASPGESAPQCGAGRGGRESGAARYTCERLQEARAGRVCAEEPGAGAGPASVAAG